MCGLPNTLAILVVLTRGVNQSTECGIEFDSQFHHVVAALGFHVCINHGGEERTQKKEKRKYRQDRAFPLAKNYSSSMFYYIICSW